MMYETLRQIPLFQGLSEEQFQCVPAGIEIWLSAGETLFNQGEPPEYFYIVLDGAVRISRQVGTQSIVLATYDIGMFFGEVPILAGTLHLASGHAVQPSHLYCLKDEDFWQMLMICPSLRRMVLGFMANRMQELQMLSYQREKLISLGTLAAGLAHELNNPAAAAHRAVEHLRQTHSSLDALAWRVIEQNLTPAQQAQLLVLQQSATVTNSLDPLLQGQQEDELADWLSDRGISAAWKLASTLVEFGLTLEQVEAWGNELATDTLADGLNWLGTTLSTTCLMDGLERSTARISELVKAVKAYSFMDQSPLQEINLHDGIENTLTILGHKLKQHNIQVQRSYDSTLPRITAYGGQLNQVWTNLIDNAIDAITSTAASNLREQPGTIRIHTACGGDEVVVEIVDNGSGIPPELQARIFEPFFTTKEVGQGTGLGLEVVHRVVVNQHHGDVRCVSQPGRTCFQLRLPIAPPIK